MASMPSGRNAAGALNLEAIARIVAQQTLRHLRSGTVVRAEEEYFSIRERHC